MADQEFLRACRDAVQAMGVIHERIREDPELDGLERISMSVFIMSMRFVTHAMSPDDDDDNPYKYDDDHTFT